MINKYNNKVTKAKDIEDDYIPLSQIIYGKTTAIPSSAVFTSDFTNQNMIQEHNIPFDDNHDLDDINNQIL